MSSPIQFYRAFQSLMRDHGIRHALTSGMACVEYGIQQNTKDTDWIIHPGDLGKLLQLLCACEQGLTGHKWRVSYRSLFGAPFLESYHHGGWTTHIAVFDEDDSPEHHLDFFGKPPRLSGDEWLPDNGGVANRNVVAQMKKTDRAKDWPFVNGLAVQACILGDVSGLLHLRELSLLQSHWRECDDKTRSSLQMIRPFLGSIGNHAEVYLERLLLIEQMIWESVNRERYRIYQQEWKDFYRRWQRDSLDEWPNSKPFASQHEGLREAVAKYELPSHPIGHASVRAQIYQKGIERTRALTSATAEEISLVAMPIQTILP